MATLKERIAQARNAQAQEQGNPQNNPKAEEHSVDVAYLHVPLDKDGEVELLDEAPIENETVYATYVAKDKRPAELKALKARWEKIRFLGNVARAGIVAFSWFIFIACVNVIAVGATIALLRVLL